MLLAVLLPLAGLQTAFDEDLLALGEIRLQRLGLLAPEHDAVPLGLLVLLAVLRRPVLGGGDAEARHRRAAWRVAHLGVTTEISHQRAIPEDGALIEIVRFAPARGDAPSEMERWGAPRYVAFVLKRDGAPALADLGEATAIEDLVKTIRQALASRRADVKDAARALDGLVMAKVRPHLGGARRLWIAPDGGLHKIPFEALVDEAGHYLTLEYGITYLGTGRDLLKQRAGAPAEPRSSDGARQSDVQQIGNSIAALHLAWI